MNPTDDIRRGFMLQAAALAETAKGKTAPNPCVGAVLVRDGRVVARGMHEYYGGPHAEVNCLSDARAKGADPAGCEMYVTLEPCNHHGKTPPCSEALIEAGVARVVIGCLDPNAGVAGGGSRRLVDAEIEVVSGVAERECRDLIRDFIIWNETGRPYVYVKMASTLDGRIAARTGHSKWITGEAARAEVHRLRARCGAVVVGGGTFRADDPRLDVRGREVENQPLAVVATSRLPGTDDKFTLLAERAKETIFLTDEASAASDAARALGGRGCRVLGLPRTPGGGLDLLPGLKILRSEANAHYVLCEGGGSLALSFVEQGLMDEFWHFTAPKVLGDEAASPMFCGRAPRTMDGAIRLRPIRHLRIGDDMLCVYAPPDEQSDGYKEE
jgi:diaminohydroxyphosphoribosylaminopyrimidine deaminase/5-amino-6-(5-phosphoribosylamino)uracil reductase